MTKKLKHEAALAGSVIELARLTGTPTPHLDTIYACARLLAKTLGEQKGKLLHSARIAL